MVTLTLCLTLPVVIMLANLASPANGTSTEMDIQEQEPNVNHCPLGCLTCSKWNGCLDCSKNFTWHLERSYLRTIGVCLRQCPPGYFISYAPGDNKCTECKAEHCDVCSNVNFCEKCQEPYLEYRGTCIVKCPQNLYHSKYRKDCYEKVDCLMELWAEWSDCLKDGKKCGYKWGNQTRSRVVLQKASPNDSPCPSVTQTQKCKLTERYCNFDNSANHGTLSNERHARRKRRRRARCRLRRRAGNPCKREDDYDITENYKPAIQRVQEEREMHNASSYYDYYRQSAELLRLLNLKQNNKQKNKNKDKKDPG